MTEEVEGQAEGSNLKNIKLHTWNIDPIVCTKISAKFV